MSTTDNGPEGSGHSAASPHIPGASGNSTGSTHIPGAPAPVGSSHIPGRPASESASGPAGLAAAGGAPTATATPVGGGEERPFSIDDVEPFRMTERMRHFLRAIAAIGSGLLLFASFAPGGLWWAGIISVFLLMLALSGRPGMPITLVIGFLWGMTAALASLPWIAEFVGGMPWVALAVTLGLFHMMTAIGIRIILGSTIPWFARAIGAAAWIVAIEALLARWPFGGFPWLRHGWGQIDGPLAGAAAIGGVALVGFLLTLIGAGVLSLAAKHFITGALLIALPLGFGLVVAPGAGEDTATVRIAAVQGNVPRMGLDFNAQRRAVLENHAEATRELAQRVRDGREDRPDLVVWPENSSDVSPFTDDQAARIIDEAARAIGAPILVGTFTYDNGTQNTMVLWDPEDGPGERHEKIYLQPFGETMPFRDLLRNVTDLVDLAGDMTPGDGDGVIHVDADGGSGIAMGIATCYEVVFDGAYRDAVNNGANILATPTNNATFGYTDMTYQQLAMSRMRAIEFDRAVVVAATSGVSAIIMPGGEVVEETAIFEQRVLTADMPLRDNLTVAARFGEAIEWAIVALAVLAFAGAAVTSMAGRGARRRAGATPTGGATSRTDAAPAPHSGNQPDPQPETTEE